MLKNQNKIVLFNVGSTIIIQGIAFLTLPYFSRILGTSNYGIVSVFSTWIQLISVILGMRINGTLIMAKKNYEEKEQLNYQSSVLVLAGTNFIVFSPVITFILVHFFNMSLKMTVLILVQSAGYFCLSFLNSKYTYEFHADYNFFLSIFVSIFTVVFGIILINQFPNEINFWGKILSECITYLLVLVFTYISICGRAKCKVSIEYWKFCIPLAIPMVFHALSGIILNQSDRLMLQTMVNDSEVGVYSLASTFSHVIFICWSALNDSWVPFYYEYLNDKKDKIYLHTKNYMEIYTGLSVGFMMLSPEVFRIFSSEDFWAGVNILPLFTVGYYFIFLYSFAINYEIYHQKPKYIAFGSVCSAVLNILLNYFMIIWFGSIGAAISTVISYIALFMFHMLISKLLIKESEFPYTFMFFMPYIGVELFAFLLSFSGSNWILRWGLSILIGIYMSLKIGKRRSVF